MRLLLVLHLLIPTLRQVAGPYKHICSKAEDLSCILIESATMAGHYIPRWAWEPRQEGGIDGGACSVGTPLLRIPLLSLLG